MEPGDSLSYKTAKAFESAVTARIANKAATSPYGVAELRRQFAYGRLLSRVFQHQPAHWVLKGATGLLARMPGQARHSMDVDLFFDGEVEMSVDALREAADLDLGDFFTFDIEDAVGLAGVTAGSQLRVTSYLGDKEYEVFRVDVVVTDTMTAEPEVGPPIEPVGINGLAQLG
jgi:Nucleotidyl transferase AbiEii toxin, Type IV TA system